MNTKNIFSILLLAALLFGSRVFAQTPVELHLTHHLYGRNFAFNQSAWNNLGNEFNLKRLEYFISKISITHDGGMVTDIPNHYILVSGDKSVVSNLGSHNITNVESISFHIGVDDAANHADPSLQPAGHPLAPRSPSMHWGWAGGYRFAALEGKSGDGLNQTFELHALGDQNYFKTTLSVKAINKGGKIIIPVRADYASALKGLDLSSGMIVHGDGEKEQILLKNFQNEVFSQGFAVSVKDAVAASFQIYPNPAQKSAMVRFPESQAGASVTVVDVYGRTVYSVYKAAGESMVKLPVSKAGTYYVTVNTTEGQTATSKLVVE